MRDKIVTTNFVKLEIDFPISVGERERGIIGLSAARRSQLQRQDRLERKFDGAITENVLITFTKTTTSAALNFRTVSPESMIYLLFL